MLPESLPVPGARGTRAGWLPPQTGLLLAGEARASVITGASGHWGQKADHLVGPEAPSRTRPPSRGGSSETPRTDHVSLLSPGNVRSASLAPPGRGGGPSPPAGSGDQQVAAGRSPLLGGPSRPAPGPSSTPPSPLDVRGGAGWWPLEKEPASAAVARGAGAHWRRAEPGPRGGGTGASEEARAGGAGWKPNARAAPRDSNLEKEVSEARMARGWSRRAPGQRFVPCLGHGPLNALGTGSGGARRCSRGQLFV